jgi:hypothetical protein
MLHAIDSLDEYLTRYGVILGRQACLALRPGTANPN